MNWKAKIGDYALPLKLFGALSGAFSYCGQVFFSMWLFHRLPQMSWDLLLQRHLFAPVIGALMGYISVSVLILWCKGLYQTAHHAAHKVSCWVIGIGLLICPMSLLILFSDPLDFLQLFLIGGMPFAWGLILYLCARRLKQLSPRNKP